jgi:hypothetical protein
MVFKIANPIKYVSYSILYGLKQASRKWYEKLTSLLVREGYKQSNSDYSLFTMSHNNDFTVLLIYVDDIMLSGTCLDEI